MIRENMNKLFVVVMAIVIFLASILSTAHPYPRTPELALADYSDLFNQDDAIFVREIASSLIVINTNDIEIIFRLFSENMLVLEQNLEVGTEENTGRNLILLWTAVSNKVLIDTHEITGATRITIKHSGKEDGILEILKSPWRHRKCFLTTAGRDQQVLMAAASLTEVSQKLNPPIQIAKCVESKDATSPFLSKIGATLDMLLALRERKEIPREMGHILKRDTVSVSIRFSHELNAVAVESIEKLGLKFTRLPNGDIARSGTIYGAEIPWDKVYDLAKLEKVVRIESAWQPTVEAPPIR